MPPGGASSAGGKQRAFRETMGLDVLQLSVCMLFDAHA